MIQSAHNFYDLLCEWWKGHGWPPISKDLLPKRGYVAFVDERPVMAAFLYKDATSSFGFMEWLISDPNSSSEDRSYAMAELIEHISKIAKSDGVTHLFTTVKNDKLLDKFTDAGFIVSDKGVTHLMKGV